MFSVIKNIYNKKTKVSRPAILISPSYKFFPDMV